MDRGWWSGAVAVVALVSMSGCVTLSPSLQPASFPAPAAGGSGPAVPLAAGPIVLAGSETPDQRYRTMRLDFTGGERAQMHYRVFEKSGRAAMCGYLTADGGARDRDVAGRWLQGASVLLGDQSFGESSFLKVHSASGAAGARPSAQCAESTLAWQPQLAGAPIVFRNGAGRRGF